MKSIWKEAEVPFEPVLHRPPPLTPLSPQCLLLLLLQFSSLRCRKNIGGALAPPLSPFTLMTSWYKLKSFLCKGKGKGFHIWARYCIAPAFLNLDTKWRPVISFTLRPSYSLKCSVGSHGIGGSVGSVVSVGSRSSVNDLETKQISC